MKTRSRLIALCSFAALAVVSEIGMCPRHSGDRRRAAAAVPASRGIDLAGIDRSVAPGDDFFAYANGTWLKTTEIPADRSAWGIERHARRADGPADGRPDHRGGEDGSARRLGRAEDRRLLRDLHGRGGHRGEGPAAAPARARRASRRSPTRRALARALGGTLRADVDVLNTTNFYTANLFGLWVAQDLDDPARYSPFLLQGGLGMPDRDYYLDPSPRMAEIRTQYQAHIAAVLKLAGIADAEAKAARIFELERRIAEAHASRADSEDVLKGNNHWTRAGLRRPRARPRLGGLLLGRGARTARTSSSSGSRARSRASPRSCAISRSRPGRTT